MNWRDIPINRSDSVLRLRKRSFLIPRPILATLIRLERSVVQGISSEPLWGVPMKTMPVVDLRMLP
jgi:hypothetical protein